MSNSLDGPAARPLFDPASEGLDLKRRLAAGLAVPPGGLAGQVLMQDAAGNLFWNWLCDCQPVVGTDGTLGDKVGISDSAAVSGTAIAPAINPGQLDDYTAPGLTSAQESAISGTVLYVCSASNDTVVAIDISDPANLVQIGSVTDFPRLDFPNAITISGTVAYVATVGSNGGFARVTSINIATPATPVVLDDVLVNGSGVGSSADLALLGANHIAAVVSNSTVKGLAVIDRTDPSVLSVVGTASFGLNAATSVAVVGDYAFVLARANSPFFLTRLVAVNCTNRAAPTVAGFYEFADGNIPFTGELVEYEGYVVFAYGSTSIGGFIVFDVSTPSAPTIAADFDHPDFYGTIVGASRIPGESVIVATCVQRDTVIWVDMSNPLAPSHIATRTPTNVSPTGDTIGPDWAANTATHSFVSLRNARIASFAHFT